VPFVDRGLQAVALGQQRAVDRPKVAHYSGEPGPERLRRLGRAGQKLRDKFRHAPRGP